jgi:hypothetical protein
MKTRLPLLGATIALATAIAAGSAAADNHEPTGDTFRVMIQTKNVLMKNGGLDSFSVAGNLEDCRRIASASGESFPQEKNTLVSTFCVDTTSGVITAVGEWRS